MTNGGGTHESARVVELSEQLQVPLSVDNFMQSHTPFKTLVEGNHSFVQGDPNGYKDKTILVIGGDGDSCRQVAETFVPTSGLEEILTNF